MFSIIFPLDTNRLEQFSITKRLYDAFPQPKEYLIPTRSLDNVRAYMKEHDLMRDVKFLPYKFEGGFNPSMALNMGVRAAKYGSIIITSPEVKPTSAVLPQLAEVLGRNVICKVDDELQNGSLSPLVNTGYRANTPSMYFLAMFNKSDIEAINGWDEEFMRGYAFEDDDFGARWCRAGLPFEVRDDITGVHQYHLRSETRPGGWGINSELVNKNTGDGIIRPKNGLEKL